MYGEFEKRNTVVIAVAQEDTTMNKHNRIRKNFKPRPRFQLAADLGRNHTSHYDRTTAYLIDKKGIVRQIFPMLIHARPSWQNRSPGSGNRGQGC